MSEHKRREKQLEAYLAERDALFHNPNQAGALAHWKKYGYPAPVAPSVPLAAIHKARLSNGWTRPTPCCKKAGSGLRRTPMRPTCEARRR
jgi:hypothetical protein